MRPACPVGQALRDRALDNLGGRVGSLIGDLILDLEYEISTREGKQGQIVDYRAGGARSDVVGRTCHEALFDRTIPCANCPFFPSPPVDERSSRIAVIQSAKGKKQLLVVGRRISAHRVRVTLHTLGRDLLGQLLESRLDAAATEANLSGREREALTLMMIGRSLGEIATALGITVRTAKYHQSNVLAKLGADSRLDLLRLLS